MRSPLLDPVLAAHLLACPPCREARTALADVPAPRETAPPARVWDGILGEVHRRRRVEARRHRLRRPARRRPRR